MKSAIFRSHDIRAFLDGKKTMHRWPVPFQCGHNESNRFVRMQSFQDGTTRPIFDGECSEDPFSVILPYNPGDQIWVKETWAAWDSIWDREASELNCSVADLVEMGISQGHIAYKADPSMHADKWRSPVTMPQWASRITLEVTGVRVEKLQSISEEDARNEGIIDGGCLSCGGHEPCNCSNPRPCSADAFFHRWISEHGFESLHANPWVIVAGLRRIK